MGEDQLTSRPAGEIQNSIQLVAEEGASLSSGSLRLYAIKATDLRITPKAEDYIGAVDLYAYDPLNRRCAVGIMVATDHRRQGYALAMLHALQSLYTSRGVHGPLHILYADIAASNTASLALFSKAGYTECGHFKEWLYVNGQYIDSIRMQKIL